MCGLADSQAVGPDEGEAGLRGGERRESRSQWAEVDRRDERALDEFVPVVKRDDGAHTRPRGPFARIDRQRPPRDPSTPSLDRLLDLVAVPERLGKIVVVGLRLCSCQLATELGPDTQRRESLLACDDEVDRADFGRPFEGAPQQRVGSACGRRIGRGGRSVREGAGRRPAAVGAQLDP